MKGLTLTLIAFFVVRYITYNKVQKEFKYKITYINGQIDTQTLSNPLHLNNNGCVEYDYHVYSCGVMYLDEIK